MHTSVIIKKGVNMSIIDTFDNETEAMIHLEDVCQKSTIQLDVCILSLIHI